MAFEPIQAMLKAPKISIIQFQPFSPPKVPLLIDFCKELHLLELMLSIGPTILEPYF